MENEHGLDTLIQEKLDGDTDFQSSLDGLSDDEVTAKIEEKKREVIPQVFKEISEKAAKHEELANNYKTRAEKAEKSAKQKSGTEEPKQSTSELSSKDVFVLIEAKVSTDDIDDVVAYAKFKNISVADAVKDSTMKAILADKVEKRNTANATSTGKQTRTQTRSSDDAILKGFREGKIPQAGSPEAQRLFELRRGLK